MGMLDIFKGRHKAGKLGRDKMRALYSGGGGETVDDPVIIRADSAVVGIPLEYMYIANIHGEQGKDWHLESQAVTGGNGPICDALHIRLKNGKRRTYYFDISRFFGRVL